MLRRLLIVSLVAGLAAGALATLVQSALLTPLILEAETYEAGAAPAHAHDARMAHEHEAGPAHVHEHAGLGLERLAYTALANLLAGVGFALLLNAAMTVRGRPLTMRDGLLWGLAGFAAFALAPALGLPPELPGSAAAEIVARQLWWLAAAAATAGGLALAAFGRSAAFVAGGLALIVLPHLVGAPEPERSGGAAPPELAAHFAVLSLAAAALFWAALGGVSGLLRERRWV
jgi:cobalt transporter subunit CbtA